MSKHFLYFDLRRGLTNQVLKEALLKFLPDHALENQVLNQALYEKITKDQNLTKQDLLYIKDICDIINKIDPCFIMCSKIFISSICEYSDEIRNNLINLPLCEVSDYEIEIELACFLILKNICGKYGERGNFLIKNFYKDIYLCEYELSNSMSEPSLLEKPLIKEELKVQIFLNPYQNPKEVAKNLFLKGARDVFYWPVQNEEGENLYSLSFSLESLIKHEVFEYIFTKNFSKNILINSIEKQSLKKRKISIPMGSKNKEEYYILEEWIYLDKIIFITPTKEELDKYMLKTGFSQEMARSDLLAAYKKWQNQKYK